ncbi:MAG: phosphatase PAP2 family protein [Syntrophobacterales bacterium]
MNREMLWDFLFPLLLLLSLSMIFWFTNVDIELQKLFYLPGTGWYLVNNNPWAFLLKYGTLPAILLVISAFLVLICGFFLEKVKKYRKIALFLIVYMILGPGLIVNTVFKEHWGRPRPKNIVEFGGQKQYLPLWKKGSSAEDKSFPSGDAAMGFFLLSPFFFLRKKAKKWAIFFLTLGISYGTIMGLTRMVRGKHFASDVLWSAGFIYLTGITLYYIFRFNKKVR